MTTTGESCLRLGAICFLTACMRIYGDPELPDLEIEWFADDCREGTTDVTIVLVGVDTPTERESRVTCDAEMTSFADLPRERYEIEGFLLDDDGGVFSRSYNVIDLRNGNDDRAQLYFGGGGNFRVAWEFDMEASCESLGADAMAIDFLPVGITRKSGCERSPYFGFPGSGTFSVRLRAEIDGLFSESGITVAASSESPPYMFGSAFLDLGTVTVSPCGNTCPEAPPSAP